MHEFNPSDVPSPDSWQPFVLSLHRLPEGGQHWDLMLQAGERLWTWRASPIPFSHLAQWGCPAVRIQDHRLEYLDYDGPVRGGALGEISRICSGVWSRLEASDADDQKGAARLVCSFLALPGGEVQWLQRCWELPLRQGQRGRWMPISRQQ